ncbi:MAG: GNAT family N-acetyltransferase [Vicinamibacterales bacterium]|nr:GNAT family N-acetyltransferase [Vicinamibacterales bacterium]
MPNLPAGVIEVTEAELPAVRAYLEARVETSLFLLSNLRAFGHRQGDSPYSGDFRALVASGDIQAVWCLTRSGHVVVQGDGRADQAPIIEADTVGRGTEVRGVLGDWPMAEALWTLVRARHDLVVTQHSREVLYRLALGPAHGADAGAVSGVRSLTASDAAAWDPLAAAFLQEQRLPVGTSAVRRAGFTKSAENGHWWGAWDGDRLVSIASFNAFYHPAAQVGGVYTVPERRRQGLSRAVMRTLLRDAVTVHRLTRVILFTGEQAHPARALYESLGFETCGAFGLYFGERRDEGGR